MLGLLLVLFVVVAQACGSAPPGPRAPTEVVRAQIDALKLGDEARAARWLTPEARARAPLWPSPDAIPDGAALVEVGRSAVWSGASEGVALSIVRGPSGWQISDGLLGLSHADSPERALDTFGRALVARDWAMVLDLLPGGMKAAWSVDRLAAELTSGARAARWKQLGEALAAGRYTLGERDLDRARAAVQLAGPVVTEVIVVREGGGWKVFDVTPRSEYIAP